MPSCLLYILLYDYMNGVGNRNPQCHRTTVEKWAAVRILDGWLNGHFFFSLLLFLGCVVSSVYLIFLFALVVCRLISSLKWVCVIGPDMRKYAYTIRTTYRHIHNTNHIYSTVWRVHCAATSNENEKKKCDWEKRVYMNINESYNDLYKFLLHTSGEQRSRFCCFYFHVEPQFCMIFLHGCSHLQIETFSLSHYHFFSSTLTNRL